MEDIEIARNTRLDNIKTIAAKAGIADDELEQYGNFKAKIDSKKLLNRLKDRKNGKLILVTSINPTPLGEGKTTMAIGLADGLTRIGKSAIIALREPSLGPVFGIKGGATGGGYAQVAPMEDINLHFTGDIHAITSANDLLSALIDNHIYYGNELGFEKVTWKRCVDLNDRQLRKVETGLSGEKNIVTRDDGFDITVASEIMAILCLTTDIEDLKRRIGNITIGYNKEEKPITVRDLHAEGALTVLLKDAIKPNLVQTLEHTPAIIHGGPFANIAHGCNSIIATKTAMKLADYTITEAGFGSDLDAVVCVATIRALKYHGGQAKEEIKTENLEALQKGIKNLNKHLDNLKNVFGLNVIVAINKFDTDTDAEIELLSNALREQNFEMSLVESHEKGSEGAIDLAEKILRIADEEENMQFAYNNSDSVKENLDNDAFQNNKMEFIKLWFNLLVEHPRSYVESFLVGSFGYWYPETTNWVAVNWDDYPILDYLDYKKDPIVELGVVKGLEEFANTRNIPVISMVLFSIGFNFWMILIITMYCIYKKQYRYMVTLVPIIILWLTNLASPVWCEYRYIYGMFTTMPIFLFLVTSLLNSEPKFKERRKK